MDFGKKRADDNLTQCKILGKSIEIGWDPTLFPKRNVKLKKNP